MEITVIKDFLVEARIEAQVQVQWYQYEYNGGMVQWYQYEYNGGTMVLIHQMLPQHSGDTMNTFNESFTNGVQQVYHMSVT